LKRATVRVGLTQFAMSGNTAENLETGIAATRAAAKEGAQIVCLPELFRSPYFCQVEDPEYFELAEAANGESTTALGKIAKELGIVVVAPIFERRAAGVYHNSAVVLDADGSAAVHYRKMHIPDDPQYYEKFYFTPGDLGFKAAKTKFATIGILICWDQWFPEGARLTALRGAEILFYPTAIGWLPVDKPVYGDDQHSAWETVQRGHAIANGVFLVAVNRVGTEGDPKTGIEFWGRSFVADPQGVVLARAGETPQNLVVPCDLGRIEEVRRLWPFLRDRRIDAYSDITSRYLD